MGVQKLAIIGWDAATFDVILPLLEAGALPNMQRLVDCGVWGTLVSTLHPLSPTAWASFMTGMNPGKHGVFDFVGLSEDGRFRFTNGAGVKSETLWSMLSRAGRRVVVINVPMTYPPERVNGVLVAGMDAPQQDRAFTYPPGLSANLHERFGGYRSDIPSRAVSLFSVKRFTARYVKELCDLVDLRARVTCDLLERHSPDFVAVVFTALDRAQHALGHLMAPIVSPDDPLGRVCRACDEALGRVLEKLDNDWIVLVMSDHGACAYRRVFELGTWLAAHGWLQLRPPPRFGAFAEHVGPIQRRLVRLFKGGTEREPDKERFLDRIVWEETKVFAIGAFGSIYVNTRDRFPNGIVTSDSEYHTICEQITEELLAVRDVETGARIVRAVHRADEQYCGPYVHLAPDLLVETTHDYFVRNNLDHHEGRVTYPAGRYRGRSLAHTGRHTADGILVACGGPFAPGENRTGAHIMDVAPTVLYLSGLPVPAEMDGKPLLDWLDPVYRRTNSVEWTVSQTVDAIKRDSFFYDEEDASAIQSRLEGLGYIG
jgi:predicted AlkP superfamily phosphohydrolase/phosphomutase